VTRHRQTIALIGCGGVLSAVALAWALEGDQTRRVHSFLVLFGLAAAAYLIALRSSRGLSPRGLAAAMALAVVWRVGLVLTPPLLSDDIYRYVWEGRIQLHGGNPYRWADRPEAEKWAPLRDDLWAKMPFKDLTAIYPPLGQVTVRCVVGLHDSVTAMKVFVVLAECALWLLVLALLARRRLPRERLLILAWSPLALVEIAGSGHNDALGMLLAAGALLALESDHPFLSTIAAALGAEAKFLPGLFAVSWLRRFRLSAVAAGVGAAALVALPYLAEPAGLVRSLSAYGRSWRFNHTLFAVVQLLSDGRTAPVVVAVLTLAVALALAWKRADPALAGLVVTTTWLLLSPNVLPWYALWLLPWLVLVEAPGALAFTLTAPLAYLVYPASFAGGPWQVGWGVRALEYGPGVLIALWQLQRWRITREAH
jgi:hypothetical protein